MGPISLGSFELPFSEGATSHPASGDTRPAREAPTSGPVHQTPVERNTARPLPRPVRKMTVALSTAAKASISSQPRPAARLSASLQAVSKRWPKYAFWLATGICEINHGHTRPARSPDTHRVRERTMAWGLFAKMIEYVEWLDTHPSPNVSVEEARQQYYESEIGSLSVLRDDQEKSLEQLEARESHENAKAKMARGKMPI